MVLQVFLKQAQGIFYAARVDCTLLEEGKKAAVINREHLSDELVNRHALPEAGSTRGLSLTCSLLARQELLLRWGPQQT